MKNDLVKRQKQRDDIIAETYFRHGYQKCYDLMMIVLRNPAIMKKDTFGPGRIKIISEALRECESVFHDAYTIKPEADYLQEQMDAILKKAYGEEFVPFEKRYPYMKTHSYDKKWRDKE